ncbi:MAG: hypothetical protein IJC12_03665 [Peptococcaceae bacterium]|nr:hypothetical protein [Peptococcaceae bacterium]
MLERKKSENETTYGAGRRQRNIEVTPAPIKRIFTDDDFAGVEFTEEAELTPEEQLEADFADCEWLEPKPRIRISTTKEECDDFDGLEADTEENATHRDTGESIVEMLKREKLQYIADEKEEEDMTAEEYEKLFDDEDFSLHLESDEEANKAYFSESFAEEIPDEGIEIILSSEEIEEDDAEVDFSDIEVDDEYAEESEYDDEEESCDLDELEDDIEEEVAQIALSTGNDTSAVDDDDFWEDDVVDFSALFPEIDTEQGLFHPKDYLQPLDFEMNANPEDPVFQTKQFEAYGIDEDKNGFILNSNIFAKTMSKKIYAKKFNKTFFFYNRMKGVYEPISTDDFQTIAKTVLDDMDVHIWKSSTEKQYSTAFQREIMRQSVVQCNARYIAFRNGTLDLAQMKLIPHFPEPFITNYLDYNYEPEATCPLWEETLDIIFHGDKDVVESFREMVGSFLLHGEDWQRDKLFILLGNGANGKSLCTRVIKHVLTDNNCSAQTFAQISSRFGLAPIYDKFLNISSENEQVIKDSSVFKALTSGDDISIEFKYKDAYRAVPYVKLVCATNHMPTFCDHSDGMIRRLHIFDFDIRFVDIKENRPLAPNEHPVDRGLLKKLKAERAGILNWALVGTERLMQNNKEFSMPEAIKKHNNQFALEANPVKCFFDSCVKRKEGGRVETPKVFSYYQQWLKLHQIENTHFSNRQAFHKEFKNLLRTFLGCNPNDKLTLQADGADRYRDIEIDVSLPLVIPDFF